MLGLYAIGFVIPMLITAGNIHLRKVDAGQFAFLLVIMLMITWIQTTFEELIFRGLFLRWLCKNNLGYTKKAWIIAVISSLIFALAHVTNPEVTSQSGLDVLLVIITYAVPGFVYFWADMHFGNLLPGIVLHWINNFLLFTMISAEEVAFSMPTLFIDTTPNSAVWIFASTALTYVPVLVYLLVDVVKRKKSSLTK